MPTSTLPPMYSHFGAPGEETVQPPLAGVLPSVPKPLPITEDPKQGIVASDDGVPTWVTEHSGINSEWKSLMARYVAHHFVNYADPIQVASGTSLNSFMDAVIERQLDSLRTRKKGLDLVIITSNLQVVAKALARRPISVCRLSLTGGTYQGSLDSLPVIMRRAQWLPCGFSILGPCFLVQPLSRFATIYLSVLPLPR